MAPGLSGARPKSSRSEAEAVHDTLRESLGHDRSLGSGSLGSESLGSGSLGKLEPKMLIGFTCKACEHRSHHTMSKQAYTHGTVIIHCPGCRQRHLIADHLNWFDKDHMQGKRTIEELLEARGEAISRQIDATGSSDVGD